MDKKVLKFLKNYIKKHTYGRNADYTLQSLFYAYESKAINSIEGLFVATQEFVKFLYYNKQKILKSIKTTSPLTLAYFEKEYDQILFAFDHISDNEQIEMQSKFVRLSGMLYDEANTKILDVGAGGIPLTSFLFTNDYSDVSSMDRFLLSEEFLKAQNITPYNQYFTRSTKVSDFDYVVGRRPCSAITNIVENCAKENKPYFLELCDCHLDKIKLPDGSHPSSWEEVLPDLDHDIKFVDNYAFNIDASKSQVVSIIEHLHPHIFQSQSEFTNAFIALSFLIDCFNDIEQELFLGLQ